MSVRLVSLDLSTVSPLVCPSVNTFSLLVCVIFELEMLKTLLWLLECISI